jgi:hypothetical protein
VTAGSALSASPAERHRCVPEVADRAETAVAVPKLAAGPGNPMCSASITLPPRTAQTGRAETRGGVIGFTRARKYQKSPITAWWNGPRKDSGPGHSGAATREMSDRADPCDFVSRRPEGHQHPVHPQAPMRYLYLEPRMSGRTLALILPHVAFWRNCDMSSSRTRDRSRLDV